MQRKSGCAGCHVSGGGSASSGCHDLGPEPSASQVEWPLCPLPSWKSQVHTTDWALRKRVVKYKHDCHIRGKLVAENIHVKEGEKITNQ